MDRQNSIPVHDIDSSRPDHVQSSTVVARAYADAPVLPPVDRGRAAWGFLVACWAVEALVWGFGFSFGIFQDFYSSHEPFAGSPNIAVIGTTTTGALYIGTPFVLMLCRTFRRLARWFTLMGLVIASSALALSSFCQTVPQLIGVQGVLFGVGGCFAYCPCVMYIDEWFDRRKGMAYGVMWSAAGFGGVVLPLLLETLLDKVGFQTATRILAGILFACSAPLSFFVKPRLPHSDSTNQHSFNMRYTRSKVFVFHQLASLVQATGYFLPGIYLPSYTRATFGASSFTSALTVILINVASAVGTAAMGTLTDKLRVTTCILISATGAAISVLVIWGFSVSLPVLYVFCLFYGLFGGAWTAVWPGIMRDVAQRCESQGYGHVDPVMVFGYLCVGRGLGNVISGPLSEALLKGMPFQGLAIGAYGSGYGSLVVYSGLASLVSGMNAVWKCVGLL